MNTRAARAERRRHERKSALPEELPARDPRAARAERRRQQRKRTLPEEAPARNPRAARAERRRLQRENPSPSNTGPRTSATLNVPAQAHPLRPLRFQTDRERPAATTVPGPGARGPLSSNASIRMPVQARALHDLVAPGEGQGNARAHNVHTALGKPSGCHRTRNSWSAHRRDR